jgi:OCRE domain
VGFTLSPVQQSLRHPIDMACAHAGYYYDAGSGLYYDANSGLFFDPGCQQWLLYDASTGSYTSVGDAAQSISTAAQSAIGKTWAG